MGEWRSVDHVKEARSVGRVPFEPPPAELLREAPRGGRYSRHDVQPGEVFGELTAIEVVGRSENGSYVWICRCACGGEALRTSAALNQAVRAGRKPSCGRCGAELRSGGFVARADALAEAYRRQYVDYRTLWTPWQVVALMDGVRRDLEVEFGTIEDRLTCPALPLQHAAGWPYSANRRSRSGGEDREDDAPAEPERSELDRRRDELTAQLALAVESSDADQIDRALAENAAFDAKHVRAPAPEPPVAALPRVVSFDPWTVRCRWCGQRVVRRPPSEEDATCSVRCATRYLAWVARETGRKPIPTGPKVPKSTAAVDQNNAASKRVAKQLEILAPTPIDLMDFVRPALSPENRDMLADPARLGKTVESLQRQFSQQKGVDAEFVGAGAVRGRAVLTFKMRNRGGEALHVILYGKRAAWIIGAESAAKSVKQWEADRPTDAFPRRNQ